MSQWRKVTEAILPSLLFLICTSCRTRTVKLPSADREYWREFQRIQGIINDAPPVDVSQSFYETIANAPDVQTQSLGIRTLFLVDGVQVLPVFRAMVLDDRFSDETRALEIYGSAGASFLAGDLPGLPEYSAFLDWAQEQEKGSRSRSKMDRILQRTDPEWQGSAKRIRFLKRSLGIAETEAQKESIRRKIRENDTPLPPLIPASGNMPTIHITP